MTITLTIPAVPLLPAALIHSTASTTVMNSSISNNVPITLLASTITTHIQIMAMVETNDPVNDTVTISGASSSLTYGSSVPVTFVDDIVLTDVAWNTKQGYGQYTILTIELPHSARVYALEGIVVTLLLVGNSNGIVLQFSAVSNGGSPQHHRLLAGVPNGTLPGFPLISSNTITTSKYSQITTAITITIPEGGVVGVDNLLVISFYIRWVRDVPIVDGGPLLPTNNPLSPTYDPSLPTYQYMYYLYTDAVSEISDGAETLGYVYSPTGSTNCIIGIECNAIDVLNNGTPTGQYQMMSIIFQPNIALPTAGSQMVLKMTGVKTAVPGYGIILGANGNPLVQITPSSTITRPVGYCTAATPDYYDVGLGAYLGADFATGNCVTQRSNSTTACRPRSMCLINTQTIVGNTSKIVTSVPMKSTFSPLSPDMGVSVGTPFSTIPKAFPIGHDQKISVVPPHLKARSALFGASTCAESAMYFIPENTQDGLTTDGTTDLVGIFDVYSVTLTDQASCAYTQGSQTYPAYQKGASGCGPLTAVCVPGTTPLMLNSVANAASQNNCNYVCQKDASMLCTTGYTYVADLDACFRTPPTNNHNIFELKSNDLCATITCPNGAVTDTSAIIPIIAVECAPLSSTDLATHIVVDNSGGWQVSDSGCVTTDTRACVLGATTSGMTTNFKCSDQGTTPFIILDTYTTVPCGYYYWSNSTPITSIFNMYEQTLCSTPAGCTDLKTKYTLGWDGIWT